VKILVYDDNPDFGGHQIMACHGIKALATNPSIDVIVMINPENKKLADRLPALGNIQTIGAPCSTRKIQGLRNRLARRGIRALGKQFQALEADLVLCIQGDIEESSQAVLAARKAGIECVSYIAIPHPMQHMGAKWGKLRDRINQYLLNQPDRYLTLSESMAEILRERGVTKPIAIVPNGIKPPSQKGITPHRSRLTLGLMGRVEFKQKQQDFMVETFCEFPSSFSECQLIIAGSGPDEENLRNQVQGKENITLLPWQNNAEAFYEQIDFLVIPSRFEGVPLVMLEALAHGIPVIASACDGMKDLLPESWTFEPENGKSLADTFSKVRNTWKSEIAPLQQKVLTDHSLKTFKENFRQAIYSRD